MLSLQEQVMLSFKTVIEMLTDRGVSTDALTNISPKELEALAATQNVFTINVLDDLNIVYYLTKMKISEFKTALLGKNKDDVFHIKELLFNVSNHEKVPKHKVVKDAQDVEAIMKKYNIKSKPHFRLIHASDAMAKYLGLQPGDLVKITRPSPTAGEYNYYRICIA
eukprot:gene19639-26325_t